MDALVLLLLQAELFCKTHSNPHSGDPQPNGLKVWYSALPSLFSLSSLNQTNTTKMKKNLKKKESNQKNKPTKQKETKPAKSKWVRKHMA